MIKYIGRLWSNRNIAPRICHNCGKLVFSNGDTKLVRKNQLTSAFKEYFTPWKQGQREFSLFASEGLKAFLKQN